MKSNDIVRNDEFYSTFFKNSTFLSFKKNFYTRNNYIKSLGYSKKLFEKKVVLEIGAGSGRLFFGLSKNLYLKKVKKYIVSEPSNGLDYIKSNCKLKKVYFKKKKL